MNIVRTELGSNIEHNLKSKQFLRELIGRVFSLYETSYSGEKLQKKIEEVNKKKKELQEKKQKLSMVLTKAQELKKKISQKSEELSEKNRTLKETILEKLGSKE